MEETKRYKKAILIPEGVTPTIFALPCIYSCHKEPIKREQSGAGTGSAEREVSRPQGKGVDGGIVYLLYDWDEQGNYIGLRPGQWLCECYDGKWEVKDKL